MAHRPSLHPHSSSSTSDEMEERTTVESPPVEKLMSQQRPDVRRPSTDDRATLEVASMNRPPWSSSRPPLGSEPRHAPIDSEEEEPTVEAGKRHLGQPRDGTMDEPTIDRQEPMISSRSRGSGRRPPYQQPPPATLGPTWAKLVVTAGNDNGREFTLNGKPITVGRALDNDVVLSDIAVSRKHLSLAFDGRRYLLIDHASGNGTLINDRLETGTCLLTDGDRLELGNTIFRFEHPASRGLAPDQRDAGPDADAFAEEEPRTVVGKSKRNIAPLPLPGGPAPQPASQPQHRLPIPGPQDTLPPDAGNIALPGLTPSGNAPIVPAAMAEPAAPPMGAPEPRLPVGAPEPRPGAPMQARPSSDPGMGNFAIPAQMSPEAMLATSPIPRFAPFAEPKRSRRGLVLFLLFVLAAGMVVAFVMVRGMPLHEGDEMATGATGDDSGDGDRTTTAPLPRATWGTDETTMLASIGVTEVSGEPDDGEPNDGDDGDDGEPRNGGDGDDGTSDNGATNRPDIQKIDIEDTDPPDNGNDSGDQGDGDSAGEDQARRTAPVTKPVRRATRVDRPNTGAARKRALSQYRNKDFDAAASLLRSTASDAGGKEASELRALASNYEKVGAAMNKGNAAFTRDPVAAMLAYKSAMNLDKRHGDGAHTSFIRSKLSVVAPKAAASYMAKDKYEAAKSAADTAASSGASNSPMVQRVRQGLERQAGEFYKSSLRMKNEPDKARKLLERILNMVPPSSPWYSKAYKRLNTR